MRRVLPVLVGIVLVAAGAFGLLQFFQSNDSGELAASEGPGVLEEDRGSEHTDDEAAGTETSPVPSSGPHAQRNVTTEKSVDDSALLHALELGDVAFVYGDSKPPPDLVALREEISGPFDPELAAAGQMVLLVRRRGTAGVQAVAWRRRLDAAGPDDPQLRAFAEAWLGQGQGRTG